MWFIRVNGVGLGRKKRKNKWPVGNIIRALLYCTGSVIPLEASFHPHFRKHSFGESSFDRCPKKCMNSVTAPFLWGLQKNLRSWGLVRNTLHEFSCSIFHSRNGVKSKAPAEAGRYHAPCRLVVNNSNRKNTGQTDEFCASVQLFNFLCELGWVPSPLWVCFLLIK